MFLSTGFSPCAVRDAVFLGGDTGEGLGTREGHCPLWAPVHCICALGPSPSFPREEGARLGEPGLYKRIGCLPALSPACCVSGATLLHPGLGSFTYRMEPPAPNLEGLGSANRLNSPCSFNRANHARCPAEAQALGGDPRIRDVLKSSCSGCLETATNASKH